MKATVKRILGEKTIRNTHAAIRFIKGIYYRSGDNVECPICTNTYSKFLTFCGRDNVWCPSCRSLERHRLLYLFLRDRKNIFAGQLDVLQFAPEICFDRVFRRCDTIHYRTANLMISFIHEIEALPDYTMSVTDIQFEDNSFDVIICNQVLEHVQDDNTAMKEIYRVLKKGGYAVLQVPINIHSQVTLEDPGLSPAERAERYGYADHVRYYGLDYKDRLANNGFAVCCEDYVRELDFNRYVLDKDEIIYVCYK
ncbi:MAG: SAM-dependent methyltransferase [Thermodesulfovibrio sp.]|nr:SAM-dependent methyltransferase [Thermodesulfovibrio sp.]